VKNSDNSKILGSILMFAGILGVIFSLTVITATWLIKGKLENNLANSYKTISSAILNTKDGLTLIGEALSEAEQSLTVVGSSLTTLNDSLFNLSEVSSDSGTLIGTNFVEIVDNAQTSLDSSASGAKLIDDTLNLLSSIPLLGLDFRPKVPLHTSLLDLSTNLNLLPENLHTIESYLAEISLNLGELRLSVELMNTQVSDLISQVNQAKDIIAGYQQTADEIGDEISHLGKLTSSWLTVLSVAISVFMIWLLLIQISPLLQAYELLHGKTHYVKLNDIREKADEKKQNIVEKNNG